MREETITRTRAIEQLKADGMSSKEACEAHHTTLGAHTQALTSMAGYQKRPHKKGAKKIKHETIYVPDTPKADLSRALLLLEMAAEEIRKHQ